MHLALTRTFSALAVALPALIESCPKCSGFKAPISWKMDRSLANIVANKFFHEFLELPRFYIFYHYTNITIHVKREKKNFCFTHFIMPNNDFYANIFIILGEKNIYFF